MRSTDRSRLRPVALRIGPLAGGRPAIELVCADGRCVILELDVAHASVIAERLNECIDGRITKRPASRRVLELTLAPDADAAQ